MFHVFTDNTSHRNFGVADTQFDFSKTDIKSSKDRQRMLQEKYNSMRKNVKTDVLQDIDRYRNNEYVDSCLCYIAN